MMPYSFYLKTILESAINLEAAKFAYDDDEQNYGYSDDDDEPAEDPTPATYSIETDGTENDDESEVEGSPESVDSSETPETNTKSSRDTSKASYRQVQEQRRKSGNASLLDKLEKLGLSVYNAWAMAGAENYPELDEIMGNLLELASGVKVVSPEKLVGTMETLGIKAKEEGLELGDTEVGQFTFDMLSEMYFNSMLNSKTSVGSESDVAIPEQAVLEYKARLIDDNIKGKGVDTTPTFTPGKTAYKLLGTTAKQKDKTVTRKRNTTSGRTLDMANTDMSNANVKYTGQVPSGRSFYCVPHLVFNIVKEVLSKKDNLPESYNVNDLAAEYLFLGSTTFEKKYKLKISSGVNSKLPATIKNDDRSSLSTPCFASVGADGKVKFGLNFCTIMLKGVLALAPVIVDSSGRAVPRFAKALTDALKNAKKLGNTWQVSSKDLADAINGQYSKHSTQGGTIPLFDYFTTNTLHVSTSAQDASSGETMSDDRGNIAASQNEYMQTRSEDMESGNAVMKAIDSNFWNRINSDVTQRLFKGFGIESPDINADDVTNMRRTTELLVAISRQFESAGVRSRITTYDDVYPTVEIARSEITPANSITASWSDALKSLGGKKGAITGILANVDVYSIVNDLLEWTESYAGECRQSIDDVVNNLTVGYTAENARDMLAPNVDIEHIIAGAVADAEEVDLADVAKYTAQYVHTVSKRMGLPFLANDSDLVHLLVYITTILSADDADDDSASTFTAQCVREVAKLVYWYVELGTYKLVPSSTGGNARTDNVTAGQPVERRKISVCMNLLSISSNRALSWLQHMLFEGDPMTSILVSMGLLKFARKMSDTKNRTDYLLSDREDNSVSIWTAYRKFGNDKLLKLIADVCGDSGHAIKTLWEVINSKGSVDGDIIDDIKPAVSLLSSLEGITFKINVQSSIDDTVVTPDDQEDYYSASGYTDTDYSDETDDIDVTDDE